MNLLILGATGRVGSHIANYAYQDGHSIKVLTRSPEKLALTDKQLTIVKGNVLHHSDVEAAMRGTEIVISALNTDGTTTLSESMPYIIQAMSTEKIQRIITVGTAGILQSRSDVNLLRYESNESRQRSTRAAEEHRKVYELLQQSSLDWTIVCPTYLPDGEFVGKFRQERNYLPIDGMEISVPDTARFTYEQIYSNEYIRSRVGIAY